MKQTQTLSNRELLLLQKVHDGEVSRDHAADLLERPSARVYLSALEELQFAANIAMEVAAESASFDADAITDAALSAAALTDAPISELAPMLERFHDGEVDYVEGAVVVALLEEREDVVDYIAALDSISKSVQVAGEDVAQEVNFDGFFDSVAAKLDLHTPQEGGYNAEEHRVMVYRYFDAETTQEERQRVEAWVDIEHQEVTGTLEALDELKFSATTAVEYAQENIDFSHFYGDVQDRLDAEVESQGENVVALGSKRREKESFFSRNQQSIYGAVAATVAIGFFLGLFGQDLFGTKERVIERIVIVDSVEYAPGASVMINSPMESASAERTADPDQEEEPTVIWLLDSGDDSLEDEPGEENELETDENQEGQPI